MLKFKRLHRDAVIPYRALPGDSGMDICSCERVAIGAWQRGLVKTGLACAFPQNYVLKVENKSGRSIRDGWLVGGGVIDSTYRGEIQVVVFNLSHDPVWISPGDKIAQLILYPIWFEDPIEVDDLTETVRGENGFGSTGDNEVEYRTRFGFADPERY